MVAFNSAILSFAADRLMSMRNNMAYLERAENGEEVVSVDARKNVSDLVEVRQIRVCAYRGEEGGALVKVEVVVGGRMENGKVLARTRYQEEDEGSVLHEVGTLDQLQDRKFRARRWPCLSLFQLSLSLIRGYE